jgi:transcriptional regulator GlxA family with amidase domain
MQAIHSLLAPLVIASQRKRKKVDKTDKNIVQVARAEELVSRRHKIRLYREKKSNPPLERREQY